MQLVEVQTVCDQCYVDTEERVEIVDTVEVGFGKNAYELDLCGEHLAAYQALRAFAEEHGRPLKRKKKPVAAPAPAEATHVCECGKPFTNPQALRLHKRGAHESTGVLCPECDRPCASMLGLMTHRRAMHSIRASEQETLDDLKAAEASRDHLVAVGGGS